MNAYRLNAAPAAQRRLWRFALSAVALAAVVWLAASAWLTQQAPAQEDDNGGSLPTVAFVAQAGEFADALAASAIAGQLGAPLFLTPTDSLVDDTASALQGADPDVVVLAGGTAALSTAVEQQVGEAVPDADVQRRGGAHRMETAVLLADLAEEMGFDRPLLTGATVDGTAGVDGLEVAGVDVAATMQQLSDRVGDLEDTDVEDLEDTDNSELEDRVAALEGSMSDAEGRIDDLEATVADQGDTIASQADTIADLEGRVEELETADNGELASRVESLETTFDGVTREDRQVTDDEDNEAGLRDTLVFEGMNVQLVNGDEDEEGGTSTASANGLGNLIVGYNAPRGDDERTGSHNVVIGDEHEWTSWGGIVAGHENTITGVWSTVTGGSENTAAEEYSSVTGGLDNEAVDSWATVSGGWQNSAGGGAGSISGGVQNITTAQGASILGGFDNEATARRASVSGGWENEAAGRQASILGGRGITITEEEGIYPSN